MFGSRDDTRKKRPASLLSLELEAALGIDGISLPNGTEEDAVTRHAIARSRRLRRASPLLAGTKSPTDHPDPAQDADLELDIDAQALRREIDDDRGTGEVGELPEFPHAHSAAPEARPSAPAGRARTVAGTTLAGSALGVVLALAWPSGYVATSELMIDPRGVAGTDAPLGHEATMTLVDSQVRVLLSGTMLGAVAERLNLAVDPEFAGGGSVLGSILGNDDADAGRRRSVEKLGDAVSVERAQGTSVITVSARTGDPRKSALIANTLSELYVAETATASAGEPDRRASLRQSVEDAERAIEAFKREHELVDTQGRLISDDEIARLGELAADARARTTALNARAASTREANVDSIVTGSLPEQFASPALADLRIGHAAAKQQLDRLSVKLGPRHPERLAAQAELEGARQEITAELRRIASAMQTELRRAVEQEQQLASQLAQLKVRQGAIGDELVTLREMERDAQAKRTAYEETLHAAQRAAASGNSAGASIISQAEPPSAGTGPSLAGLGIAGGLAGLAAGLGLTRRRDDDGDEAPEIDEAESIASDDPPNAGDDAGDTESGKEPDAMYPHYPHAHPQSAAQQPQAASPQAAAPYPYWQPMPPAMGYPAPPMQWMPPAPYPPVHAGYPLPYDPWAYQRAAAPAYAPPPAPTVVYVPVPVAAPAMQQAEGPAYREPARAEKAPQPRYRDEDHRFDQDGFIDERTSEALEEIRQSLREFREAIEDLADGRYEERLYEDRRYGT